MNTANAIQSATINIANKIRNTSLSRKQGLMPLFELISNSIHSISERRETGLMDSSDCGEIIITLIRTGEQSILESIRDDYEFPIQSIMVEDNGIGFNDDNLRSFTEADSDHKLEIGGKGIGRFVCLKAFKWMSVDSIMTRKADKVKRLAAGLNNHELDIELYKIEADWKTEIKQLGLEMIERKKDITTKHEFEELYETYLSELNEVGQAELARYIIHRKSILDLLDYLTRLDDNYDKYANENLVHNIFFPIQTTSDVVPYDKQNLWLLDERLSYHSYLASDKQFKSMDNVAASENEADRPDLLIFSNAFAFSTEKDAPYSSITIVEFKKPERNNYTDNDDEKNPLDQVERYVEDLLGGTIKNRKGRTINITKQTPFYIYIVCDLSPSLVKILERRDFYQTPDGLGYYTFKNRRYNGYIEVLSFEKVKSDAQKRNQILFDKLGLPNLS